MISFNEGYEPEDYSKISKSELESLITVDKKENK